MDGSSALDLILAGDARPVRDRSALADRHTCRRRSWPPSSRCRPARSWRWRGFPGRDAVIVVLNGLMGLPPVVVGLLVFLLLSRSGPLGPLGILFTPQAMIVAQTILIAPILAALTRQVVEDLWAEYRDELTAMNLGPIATVAALLWDARFSLATILLAGFGRAAAEVGAVIIVGGNIEGFTRVMTTSIALETSKGNLPLAIGLGIILIGLVMAVNAFAWTVRRWSERYAG